MDEQNPLLTSDWPAVHQQNEKRSLFLAAGQCTDAYLSLQNPFHARHVQDYVMTMEHYLSSPKPEHTTGGSGRRGARRGGGARRGRAEQDADGSGG